MTDRVNRIGRVKARILGLLARMPLATTAELVVEGSLGDRSARRALAELERAGWVGWVNMGDREVSRSVRRWRLKSAAASWFGRVGNGVCGLRSLDAVAARIGHLDLFYRAGVALDPGLENGCREFYWLGVGSWDAAVAYGEGPERRWLGLVWLGPGHNRESVDRRIRLAAGDWGLRPGLVGFVVYDDWQEQLARETLLSGEVPYPWVFGRVGSGWESADGLWGEGDRQPDFGISPVAGRQLFLDDWECRWPGHLWRVLEVVEQWSGLSFRQLWGMLSDFSRQHLRQLVDDGLARGLLTRDSGAYYLSGRGCDLAWLRDGVDQVRVAGRSARLGNSALVRRHDQGVAEVVLGFMGLGCPVAAGWRGVDYGGWEGRLSPDAVVWLNESPAGAGWHYLEYERRATTRGRIQSKLRPYRGVWRRDRWPALWVVDRDRAEDYLQEEAGDLGLRVLTSTSERLQESGVGGNCWMYGGRFCSLR